MRWVAESVSCDWLARGAAERKRQRRSHHPHWREGAERRDSRVGRGGDEGPAAVGASDACPPVASVVAAAAAAVPGCVEVVESARLEVRHRADRAAHMQVGECCYCLVCCLLLFVFVVVRFVELFRFVLLIG